MQHGTTIMSEVYYEKLKKEFHRAMQNKRHGMLTFGILVMLLRGNVCPHIATRT
jgi:hypothetical protein